MLAGSLLAGMGALGILAVVVIYPLLLVLRAHSKTNPPPDPQDWPMVTIITAARNAAELLPAKFKNFQSLDYPPERLSLLVASDGSTDETCDIVKRVSDPRIQLAEQTEWKGKAAVLNLAVGQTETELLLFSDVDAMLAPDVVRKLARHFTDPQVGGVCGLRRVVTSTLRLRDAQQTYINLDSRLKVLESSRGRITTNDGKVHMVRRALFRPIPERVMDDLYVGLSIIAQGARFLFEPQAIAEIHAPVRSVRNEIFRRRRMVTLSFSAMYQMRELLNPFRFGWFAAGLWINKIGRRLMPFSLLLLLVGLLWIMLALFDAKTIWVALAALLSIGASYGLLATGLQNRKLLKPVRLLQYVSAGFIGMALGAIDFTCGRRLPCAWDPKKTGQTAA